MVSFVETGGAACGVGAGGSGVPVNHFAVSGNGVEPISIPHMLEPFSAIAFGVWAGDVWGNFLADYDDLGAVWRREMVWRWRRQCNLGSVGAGARHQCESERADKDVGGVHDRWSLMAIGGWSAAVGTHHSKADGFGGVEAWRQADYDTA